MKGQQSATAKKAKDQAADLKTKADRIDQLTKELQAVSESAKASVEKDKKQSQEIISLQLQLSHLNTELEQTRSKIDVRSEAKDNTVLSLPSNPSDLLRIDEEMTKKKMLAQREEIFDELQTICTVVGRKEDLDRVDITGLLKSN